MPSLAQVAEVLRGSDAVVVSEDGQRIRRTQPVTCVEEMAKAVDARSLYAGAPAHPTSYNSSPCFFWVHVKDEVQNCEHV